MIRAVKDYRKIIHWLSIGLFVVAASPAHADDFTLPEGLQTVSDGRQPVQVLYDAYLGLLQRGWLLEIIHRSQPVGLPFALPIIALRSPQPGPAVWILAGIHGEEPAGPNAIAMVIDDIASLGETLTEFHRVLKPGGHFLSCMAREVALNPLMSSQIATFEKYLGTQVAAAIHAVCQLSDADDIRALIQGAGFKDVTVDSVKLTLEHDNAREFVSGALLASPATAAIKELSEDRRQEIIQDILDGFGDCFDGEALEFPHVSHVVSARA